MQACSGARARYTNQKPALEHEGKRRRRRPLPRAYRCLATSNGILFRLQGGGGRTTAKTKESRKPLRTDANKRTRTSGLAQPHSNGVTPSLSHGAYNRRTREVLGSGGDCLCSSSKHNYRDGLLLLSAMWSSCHPETKVSIPTPPCYLTNLVLGQDQLDQERYAMLAGFDGSKCDHVEP